MNHRPSINSRQVLFYCLLQLLPYPSHAINISLLLVLSGLLLVLLPRGIQRINFLIIQPDFFNVPPMPHPRFPPHQLIHLNLLLQVSPHYILLVLFFARYQLMDVCSALKYGNYCSPPRVSDPYISNVYKSNVSIYYWNLYFPSLMSWATGYSSCVPHNMSRVT